MRTRPPASILGWTIYFAVLAAISVAIFVWAPRAILERFKPGMAVMWFFGVIFFIVWRLDQRRRRGREGPECQARNPDRD